MSLFSKQKNILFISQSHLRVTRVVLGSVEKITTVSDTAWTLETLPDLLLRIRNEIGSDIRLVVGENLAYVVSFSLKDAEHFNRIAIKEEAQTFIPENLDEALWDYRGIPAVAGEKRSGISKGVQVVVISAYFLHNIAPLFVKAGFVIEALEAHSCTLARLVASEEKPVLTITSYHSRNLLTVSEQGIVIATQSFTEAITVQHIEGIIASIHAHLSVNVRTIIFSQELLAALFEIKKSLEERGFIIRVEPLDAALGMAKKNDIDGKDEDVLNVNILPSGSKRVFGSHLRTNEKRLLGVFCIVCIVGSVAIWGRPWIQKIAETQKSATPSAVTVLSDSKETTQELEKQIESVQPSVEKFVVQDASASYKVKVLNGSGRAGEAASTAKKIKLPAIENSTVGDAQEGLVELTTIRAKKNVSTEVLASLREVLSPEYVLSENETLDDTQEDDIIVVVGIQKTNTH